MPPGRPCSGTHRSLPRPGKSDAAQRRNAAKTSCCLPRQQRKASHAPVLFICSRNRLRSPSAERLFADWPGVETDSAGLAADAETPLEREQLEWATLVVVMERRHRQALLRRHAAAMKGKRLVCLDIPDDYAYMQAELLHLLERKAGPFLRRD